MTAGKLEGVLSRLKTGWVPVPDLLAETGWKGPTLRGALSGAAKRLGLTIERQRADGVTSYRIQPEEYKSRDDFNKSVDAAYEAVKERVAAGGEPWTPKP